MESLKPCPFCGGYSIKVDYSEAWGLYSVVCEDCDNAVDEEEDEAIEKWNTRTPGWISVDDELPDCDGKYLFYNYKNDCVAVKSFYKHYDKSMYFGGGLFTHWMPLPEAPEVKHG